MKKSIIAKFLLLFVFAFAIGCSKDDENVNPLIIGKWKHENTIFKFTTLNSSGQSITDSETYPSDGTFDEFKSDGTCILNGDSGLYQINGNKITLKINGNTAEYGLLVSNTKLTYTFNKEQFFAWARLALSASDFNATKNAYESISEFEYTFNYIKQ